MEQTDSCQRGGVLVDQMKESEGIMQMKTHKHRQQCGNTQRERAVGARWRWAKDGKMRT